MKIILGNGRSFFTVSEWLFCLSSELAVALTIQRIIAYKITEKLQTLLKKEDFLLFLSFVQLYSTGESQQLHLLSLSL